MLALNDLKALVEALRAAGVTHYSTPELTLQLGQLPTAKQDVEAALDLDHTMSQAFKKLPANYANPSLGIVRGK